MITTDLSADEARRIALAAQGFATGPPKGAVGLAQLRRVASRLGAIQIDSVNVLVRSYYLPAFSRLGPYPMKLFDRLAYQRRGMFEYFGHAASFLPIELLPLMRWRMAKNAEEWERVRAIIERRRPGYVESGEREITQRGPLAFSDLTDPGRRGKVKTKYAESSTLWWHWSDGKGLRSGSSPKRSWLFLRRARKMPGAHSKGSPRARSGSRPCETSPTISGFRWRKRARELRLGKHVDQRGAPADQTPNLVDTHFLRHAWTSFPGLVRYNR